MIMHCNLKTTFASQGFNNLCLATFFCVTVMCPDFVLIRDPVTLLQVSFPIQVSTEEMPGCFNLRNGLIVTKLLLINY